MRTQVGAFRDLHSQELQLILDELRDIAGSADVAPAREPAPSAPATATGDPAAASPKRAKWLAEQEERSRLSRRALLRGREKDAAD